MKFSNFPRDLEFGRKGLGDEVTAAEQKAAGSGAQVLNTRFAEHGDRLDNLEQKLARRGNSLPGLPPSAGRQFVESDEFKSLGSNVSGGRRVGCEVKAIITSETADQDGSAGALISPHRDAAYAKPKKRLTVRDLLPVVQVESGSVEYARQTGSTNNAATVAEGSAKPQSELKYDLVQVPIRTIAHYVIASRQILDDAPQLAGLIDTELRYGLAQVEDGQLLNGAGTGTDLNGIYTQATTFASPFAAAMASMDTKLDVIGAALLQNALADEPATGVVIHPSDWMEIRLTKNTDGEYLLGAPGAAVDPQLFGVPVVATEAMAIGKFLVGNFEAATLYDRWQARVEVSTEDSDNFRKNLVTVLAEERVGLAVKNTNAFTKGDFAAAITDLTT